MMATGKLLPEVQFPLELNRQICRTMRLTNNTDQPVAFKVKTMNPNIYCARPNTGFISPRSSCRFVVQALKESPADYQIEDRFSIQCVVTASVFNKDSGNLIAERKLRVASVFTKYTNASKTDAVLQDNTDEHQQKALIVRLMEERDYVVEQNNKLRQELELLTSDQAKRRHGLRCLLACFYTSR